MTYSCKSRPATGTTANSRCSVVAALVFGVLIARGRETSGRPWVRRAPQQNTGSDCTTRGCPTARPAGSLQSTGIGSPSRRPCPCRARRTRALRLPPPAAGRTQHQQAQQEVRPSCGPSATSIAGTDMNTGEPAPLPAGPFPARNPERLLPGYRMAPRALLIRKTVFIASYQ